MVKGLPRRTIIDIQDGFFKQFSFVPSISFETCLICAECGMQLIIHATINDSLCLHPKIERWQQPTVSWVPETPRKSTSLFVIIMLYRNLFRLCIYTVQMSNCIIFHPVQLQQDWLPNHHANNFIMFVYRIM